MTDEIVEITYLPTMRCNCRCAHCGVPFEKYSSKEIGGADIAKAIVESKYIASDVNIQICGGEPFLRSDLSDVLLPLFRRFGDSRASITTNGTHPQRICDFINEIPEEDRSRIHFAISIDGLPETHNRIRKNVAAYSSAFRNC
jgi:sulfatase maturation enzyme AslB (radical SAM superfamily)